jgi:predicted ArsR family transcriptional regulator
MERENESTRRQIVNLLRQHGGMTAKDLAAELAITSVGVRRHLALLEQEGLARATLMRQKMGRPTYVYSLTEQAQDLFPKNYQVLATQLLDAVQETEGDNAVDSVFAARMGQLLRQYRPRMEGKDLAQRVQELAHIQEEAGYMAVWEKSGEDFLLKEQNCAIYRVACRFQQACHFEIELFRRLLDADVTRLEHQIKGERCCTYLVQSRHSAGRVSKAKHRVDDTAHA